MKGGSTLQAQPPRYFTCVHAPCTQRYYFGAKFIEIVRYTPGREGWVFWRCLSCGFINSNPVTGLDIWHLTRAQHTARIRDIYTPEFCQNLIALSGLLHSAPAISVAEFEEMLATIQSTKLDDDAHDLYDQMRDVRLS